MLMAFVNIIGVLLLLALLTDVVMYIWAFFGTPILPIFNVKQGLASYYIFVSQLAQLLFFYVILGSCAAMIKGSKLPENFKK